MIGSIARSVSSALVDATSGMSADSQQRVAKAKDKKQQKKWQQEKRTSSTPSYGDFGS